MTLSGLETEPTPVSFTPAVGRDPRAAACVSAQHRRAADLGLITCPLDSLNAALEVDLDDAGHYRLDVPAGVAVKVERTRCARSRWSRSSAADDQHSATG